MSDLLNKASLVVIPSGYKEDTVYSVVPSDGSGDLSFTRASNGTRINSAGLVEDVPWNLAQQSEIFTDSYWNKVQTTITANTTTAPNGTLTADTFAGNGVNDGHYFRANAPINSGTAYTLSIYAKKNTNNFLQITYALGFGTNEYANFDLNNGVTGTIGSGATATITNVGDGWYRCTVTATATSSTTSIAIAYALITSATSARVETNTLSTSVFIWGAQLNIGSTAKPYFPTTDRLNVPRLTYQNGGGGCPSLLLEKQSTNLVIESNILQGAAAWGYSNEMTITEVSDTNPMGVSGCVKFTTTSANADHRAGQVAYAGSGFVSGDVICATAFVKANGYNFVKFGGNFGNEIAWYNLSNGTVASQQSSVLSAKIENFGNGWYRITNVYTFQNTIGNGLLYFNLTPAPTADSVYTGDGTSGCFAFGGQIEKNSSYPTSYIPTTSASATRVADACFKTGISSLIGQTSGAAFIEFNSSFFESYTQRIFTLSDGTTNNVIGFQLTGANELVFYVENGGTNQVVISKSSPAITLGSNVKIAAAYANNDFVFYVNGTQIGTDTSGSVPATSQVRFSEANASAFYLGLIKQIALFQTRLTNAELASLTTI
jgi:hypothetical protein